MNLLLLLPLALPFLCLAAVSLVGFLGVSPLVPRSRSSPPSNQASVIADLPVTSWRAALRCRLLDFSPSGNPRPYAPKRDGGVWPTALQPE